ncbi:WD40-repeat-containing domain protein [Mycena rosella]|uniref:WD40-repeat-containing domain protein n=1 Tax=Mycena rosella TaxID=1033263 RepID=A0AAD7D362_MYCRO|nr:WD40-repeat-containing domain protein [Mycena rosella]
MSETYSLLIKSAEEVLWDSAESPSLYVAIYQDNDPPEGKQRRVAKSPIIKENLAPTWEYEFTLVSSPAGPIIFRLYRKTSFPFRKDPCLGECETTIEKLEQSRGMDGDTKLDLTSKTKSSGRLVVVLSSGSAAAVVRNAAAESRKIVPLAQTVETVSKIETDDNGLIASLAAIIGKLDGIIKIGDELSKIHPYAYGAWKILKVVQTVVNKQQKTDEKLLKLLDTMVEVYSFVDDVELLSDKITRLENTVLGITRETVECAIFIHEYTGHGFMGRLVHNIWSDTSEKIDELSAVLLSMKANLDLDLNIQAIFTSAKLLDKVESIVQAATLKELNPVIFDASPLEPCLIGTRTEILADITSWLLAAESDTSNILWLHGVYGIGKSAISVTVAEYFRSLHRLGGFIFFERGKPVHNSPDAVVRTIAYGLAKSNQHIRSAVCTALTSETTLPIATLQTQFKELLLGPLETAQAQIVGPIIIILDALDECGDRDTRSKLISLIANEFTKLPPVFRFLITSRPDSDITVRFRAQPRITQMQLDISTPTTKKDILAYITHAMHEIGAHENDLGSEWPGAARLKVLAEYSGGLFIWASTALKFINGSFDPEEKLAILLDSGHNLAGRIDELYTLVLKESIQWDDETFSPLTVLAAVVLAQAPLDDNMLDSLLGLKQGYSAKVLARLGCVVQWSPGQSARLLHASFSDYITDRERSGNHPWFIDSEIQSRSLALGCLQVLNKELRFNMCGLEDSRVLNKDLPDLLTRIHSRISPQLVYAGEFWGNHLHRISLDDEIITELKHLMGTHFPYWLELLSVVGRVPVAIEALEIALRSVQQQDEPLQDFLQDALRFIGVFGAVIQQSAPQIYLSAIPFTPRQSVIHRKFASLFPSTLRFNGSLRETWPRFQNIYHGHTAGVELVVFSPDGTRIASTSSDGTIQVWDPATGVKVAGPFQASPSAKCVAFLPDEKQIIFGFGDKIQIWDFETSTLAHHWVLQKPAGPVRHVACSPDGNWIATVEHNWHSSDSKIIEIWDSKTGIVVAGPFEAPGSIIMCVAFSLDARQIACGYYHNTFRVWDAQTGTMISGPFRGHSGSVDCVAFLPDGKRIVSGSADHTVRLWDSMTGEILAGPFEGHTGGVTSVACSVDGRWIVSGSSDAAVRVWSSEASPLVMGIFEGHTSPVVSAVFSPSGKQIASGSKDGTVRIWDFDPSQTLGASDSGAVAKPLSGPTNTVTCLAYSQDGKRIVSGSVKLYFTPDDATASVHVWDSETGALVAGPFEQNAPISCVASSPDGQGIASGGRQGLRVWHSESGFVVCEPLDSSLITHVAFSPDSRHIVSGDSSGAVCVWEAQTGLLVNGPCKSPSLTRIAEVGFSLDGKHFRMATSDATVCVWDSETGTLTGTMFPAGRKSSKDSVNDRTGSVAFSPDGKQILAWNINNGQPKTNFLSGWSCESGDRLTGPFESSTISGVGFSPDGNQVACGVGLGGVRVWDSDTRAVLVGPFTGVFGTTAHAMTSAVTPVQFSPDGRNIVSCYQNTIYVWKAHPSEPWGPHPRFEDGWILDSSSRPIFWVPAWLRDGLWLPWNSLVISSRETTKLDLTNFVHGTEWQQCIDPRFRDANSSTSGSPPSFIT